MNYIWLPITADITIGIPHFQPFQTFHLWANNGIVSDQWRSTFDMRLADRN